MTFWVTFWAAFNDACDDDVILRLTMSHVDARHDVNEVTVPLMTLLLTSLKALLMRQQII